MNERIRKLRKTLGLNQIDFSKKINIGSSTLAMFETGDRFPKDIHIAQICSAFNVNEEWLRSGAGEMFIEPSVISLDEYARKNDVSDFESDIMKLYMSLDKELRNKFMQGLREIALKSVPEKNISVVKKGGLSAVAEESQSTYAAHNDAEIDDEEIKLMKQDLDEL